MTRRRNKHRPPEPRSPERSKRVAAGMVDRLISGFASQVRMPSGVLAVCGLLLLAVVLVFGQTVLFGFVNYDDDVLVSENPMVARGVTAAGVVWACTASVANMWYPLTWISYMLDSQMYGVQPWGYHLTNILLHAATSVILFLVLRRMTGSLWASAFVAVVFAVHPLQAEAVAWVGERKSSLSGLCFALTIAAYVGYVRRPFSLARYLAVAGLFTLGLLAKPTLVTLPFLLLLLDYWPLGRGMRSRKQEAGWHVPATLDQPSTGQRPPTASFLYLVIEKIPLMLLSVACSVAAVRSQADNIVSLTSVRLPTRIANALVSYVVYLGQFFWPVGLAAFYPRSESVSAWQVGGACFVLAALSVAALMLRHKQPAVLVGWLWYLGTLLPMIGLVQIGNHARADRYTYLPHIGLCMAVVWGTRWAVERRWSDLRWRGWLYGVGGVLLAAGAMACAWRQTSYWQNSERLWTRALACTSSNVIADTNLGLALAERGQFDEAIERYCKALEIKPDNIQARNAYGLALVGRGQFDEAIDQYRKALEIKPDYMQAHNNLGLALVGRGEVEEAIDHFRKALEIKPDQADAHFNLGLALANRGKFDEAIDHYQKALKIRPDYAEAHNNLGLALAKRGQLEEAIDHLRKALEIEPDYVQAHTNLGLALAACGQFDEAIDHLQKALEIEPDHVQAHVILGKTLAERGRLDEAREHYQAALGLASARNDKALADGIRARIRHLPSVAPADKAR